MLLFAVSSSVMVVCMLCVVPQGGGTLLTLTLWYVDGMCEFKFDMYIIILSFNFW
jgi:hypothetical protein